MKKIYYTPEEFLKDTKKIAIMVKEFEPEILIPILRGGMSFAHYLAENLNIRDIRCITTISYDDTKKLDKVEIVHLPSLPNNKRVLIVDDICDSGDTLYEVSNTLKKLYPTCYFKTTTLFFKKSAKFIPDYTIHPTKEWIEFFWNKNYKDCSL